MLVPGGRAFLPTYCHAQTRRSRVLSRLMCLSGFRVYTRFSEDTLLRMVTSAGLNVMTSDLSDDTMPLCYVSATISNQCDEPCPHPRVTGKG